MVYNITILHPVGGVLLTTHILYAAAETWCFGIDINVHTMRARVAYRLSLLRRTVRNKQPQQPLTIFDIHRFT